MTVRLLDENGDIVTSGTQFTSGVDEIAQTIKTRLALFYGENFRNVTEGTPWYESILGKGGSLASKEAALKSRILGTTDVIELLAFSTDFDSTTRSYSVSVTVYTTYGNVTIDYEY